MINPEKLTTYRVYKTKKKQSKNTAQYILETTMRKQTQTT